MQLKYTDQGQGPVVVLLHGFPFDKSLWTPQIQALQARYRVIAPDLRGHGESEDPEGVYTMDEMADDVLETLDQAGITGPVIVAGLSMGGYVALSLATRYPTRIKALLLINTRANADPPETARVREDLAQTVEKAGKPDAVVSTMVPKLFSPKTQQENSELIDSISQVMSNTSAQGVAGTLRGLANRPDRTPKLVSIIVPTLVLAGAEDALIPLQESKLMASAMPKAKLVVIPETGHLAPAEDPEAANRAILTFLDGLDT